MALGKSTKDGQTASIPTPTEAKGTPVAKKTNDNKVSPKVRLIERIEVEIADCKSVEDVKKILAEMKTTKGTAGRAKIDYNSIVVRDANGAITHVKCSVSELWFPISEFSKAQNSIGVSPIHKKVKVERAKFLTQLKQAKAAVTSDFMNKTITEDEFRTRTLELENKEFDVTALKIEGGTKEAPKA